MKLDQKVSNKGVEFYEIVMKSPGTAMSHKIFQDNFREVCLINILGICPDDIWESFPVIFHPFCKKKPTGKSSETNHNLLLSNDLILL